MKRMKKLPIIALLGACLFSCQTEPESIPVIGISGTRMEEVEALGDYITAVRELGGIPLIIPITTEETLIKETLKRIDGLLLTDGNMIDPRWYQETLVAGTNYDPQRDTFDILLVKRAIAVEVPILGVNRGCQIMNLAMGGTLYHNLTEELGSKVEHYQTNPLTQTSHTIKMNSNWGVGLPDKGVIIPVNSHHKQGIKEIAHLFVSMAESEDGLCEIIGSTDERHMGVQFNAEVLFNNPQTEARTFFQHFIQMARMVADNNRY